MTPTDWITTRLPRSSSWPATSSSARGGRRRLLRGDAPFVADTSAWWRAASLPSALRTPLEHALLDDRFWITPIVRMEILYSARTSFEYAALERELDALRVLHNDRAVAEAATSAYRELAERRDGYHRVPPTDTLIAAAAAEHGGVAVLHRERALRPARRGPHLRQRRASRTVTPRSRCHRTMRASLTAPTRRLGVVRCGSEGGVGERFSNSSAKAGPSQALTAERPDHVWAFELQFDQTPSRVGRWGWACWESGSVVRAADAVTFQVTLEADDASAIGRERRCSSPPCPGRLKRRCLGNATQRQRLPSVRSPRGYVRELAKRITSPAP